MIENYECWFINYQYVTIIKLTSSFIEEIFEKNYTKTLNEQVAQNFGNKTEFHDNIPKKIYIVLKKTNASH